MSGGRSFMPTRPSWEELQAMVHGDPFLQKFSHSSFSRLMSARLSNLSNQPA